jgi:RNA polymerase sigma factor (sigma-70 family)
MTTTTTTDGSLVQEYARRRDAEAFAELVRRYTPMVFSVARRVTRNPATAEEVTQECFFELARNAPRVSGQSVAGWLYRAAVNRSIDVRRSEGSRRAREAGAATAPAPTDPRSDWADLEPVVDEAIAALPADLRVPLVQHYLAGQSQADVAAALGINQSTISRRLDAAVAALRESLRSRGVVPAAALPALLAAHATDPVPPTTTAALGRLAVTGVGPAKLALPLAVKGTLAAAAVVAAAFAVALVAGPNTSPPAPAAPPPPFTPAAPVIVGPGSGRLVLTDLNRDGRVDLVAQHSPDWSMSLMSGDGRGGFVPFPGSPMKPGHATDAIAVGDVDHDGVPDLAITTRDELGEYVHVYLGDGNAGFNKVAASPFTVSAPAPSYKPRLQILDVNGDGHPDIVSSNGRRNTIEILHGDGRGGFSLAPVVRLEPGQLNYSFALGDLDGDGRPDLVATGGKPGSLVVYHGDANATFGRPHAAPPSLPAGADVQLLADVNGDRRADLIARHGTDLAVLLTGADGSFNPIAGSPFHLGLTPYAVAAADVNADGHVDLLVATVNDRAAPYRSRVAVLLGDGQTFAPAAGSPFPVGHGAYNLAATDINADGHVDLAASSFEGDSVTVLLGR